MDTSASCADKPTTLQCCLRISKSASIKPKGFWQEIFEATQFQNIDIPLVLEGAKNDLSFSSW